MKNVTISMDEDTARWARIEAAKAEKSLSRWIGEKLEAERKRASDRGEFMNGIRYLGPSANDHPPRVERFDRALSQPEPEERFDRAPLLGEEQLA